MWGVNYYTLWHHLTPSRQARMIALSLYMTWLFLFHLIEINSYVKPDNCLSGHPVTITLICRYPAWFVMFLLGLRKSTQFTLYLIRNLSVNLTLLVRYNWLLFIWHSFPLVQRTKNISYKKKIIIKFSDVNV